MRRWSVALVLMAAVVPWLSGCFLGEARHDASHWQVLEADARFLHEDWDWFWKADRPSRMHLSHEYWRMGDQP